MCSQEMRPLNRPPTCCRSCTKRHVEYQNDHPGTLTISGRWIPSRFRSSGNALMSRVILSELEASLVFRASSASELLYYAYLQRYNPLSCPLRRHSSQPGMQVLRPPPSLAHSLLANHGRHRRAQPHNVKQGDSQCCRVRLEESRCGCQSGLTSSQ
jgi:hypothetical protein